MQELRKFVNQTPVPKMTKKIERTVLSFVTDKRLLEKYPNIVENFMTEAHDDFNKIMKAYSVNRIIKPGADDFVPQREEFSFKRLGRTDRYKTFLARRANLKRNFLLYLPFNRAILDYSQRYFPQYLIDLSEFRDVETNLADLKSDCKAKITEQSISIRNNWYPKIIGIINKHHKKKIIPAKMWTKAISCAGKLINRQLNELKIRTINHMFSVLQNKRRIPILRIISKCDDDNQLVFNPDINLIYNTYETIVDEILKVGEILDPITKFFDIETEKQLNRPLWGIEIGPMYAVEVKRRLRQIINDVYKDVLVYMASFQTEFRKLYSSATREELASFLSESREFEECQSRIDDLEVLVTKVRKLVAREFFDIATIELSGAQRGLKAAGKNLIENVADKLLESHFVENMAICKEFQIIQENAIRHSRSTEALLENGDYILWVKNVYIGELKDRIQRSLMVILIFFSTL